MLASFQNLMLCKQRKTNTITQISTHLHALCEICATANIPIGRTRAEKRTEKLRKRGRKAHNFLWSELQSGIQWPSLCEFLFFTLNLNVMKLWGLRYKWSNPWFASYTRYYSSSEPNDVIKWKMMINWLKIYSNDFYFWSRCDGCEKKRAQFTFALNSMA